MTSEERIERVFNDMRLVVSPSVPPRTLLIVDAEPDDCPYEVGTPKIESEAWLRCRARKTRLITNVGEPE